MKWKDSGGMTDPEDLGKEEYFDEEQYSPWEKPTDSPKGGPIKNIPTVFILLGLAIVACVAVLLILVLSNRGDAVDADRVAALEGRIRQLEDQLDKYDAIDEKVATIWEQAKSYEKFKDRFDRTEASMSLRMDHLTLSLENLQKQMSKAKQATVQPAEPPQTVLPKTEPPKAEQPKVETPKATPPAETSPIKMQYHTVVKGDTFYSISRQYNLTVETLLRINHLKKDDVLQVGQKLIVRDGEIEKQ